MSIAASLALPILVGAVGIRELMVRATEVPVKTRAIAVVVLLVLTQAAIPGCNAGRASAPAEQKRNLIDATEVDPS